MAELVQTRTCSRCAATAIRVQGRQWLCARHYRFGQMRATAKRRAKSVPTHSMLESLARNMTCIGCGREMVWLGSIDQSRVVSLQHDRDGTLRLLCRGCNTRHATHPGDTFYTLPRGYLRCSDCASLLAESAFARDRSRPRGRRSYCKKCANIRHAEWRARQQ